jgi:hypothetical protein
MVAVVRNEEIERESDEVRVEVRRDSSGDSRRSGGGGDGDDGRGEGGRGCGGHGGGVTRLGVDICTVCRRMRKFRGLE